MRSDSYQTYIRSLNATPSYYPFGEMRALVMNHDTRRRSAFAVFFHYAAGVVLLAGIGLFMGSHFLVNESLPNTQALHGSYATDASQATDPSHLTVNVATNAAKNTAMQGEALETGVTDNSSETQNTIPAPQNISGKKSSTQSNIQSIATPVAAPSDPTILTQVSGQNEMTANRWSAFVAGGALLPGNSYSTSSIFGAAGVRYHIFGSSSFVVELRRSSFTVNHAAQSVMPRDTTVTVGGLPTQLTLGSPSQTASASTSLVNSLDVGYRFDLNPNDVLSPCAEIVAGASTVGFLSSEAAGIEYRFANGLTLDMSARAEQLFSPATSPLGSIGLEATLGFQW